MRCWKCSASLRSNDFMCRVCGSSAQRPATAVPHSQPVEAAPVPQFAYAGLFPRWIALTIDRALLMLLSLAVVSQLHLGAPDGPAATTATAAGIAELKHWLGPVAAAHLALWVLYSSIGLSLWGRTVGAQVAGVRVVDSTSGGRPWLLAAALRPLTAELSLTLFVAGVYGDVPLLVVASFVAGPITGLGYLMARWDGRNQTLHDKVAGTVVVSAGRRLPAPPPVAREPFHAAAAASPSQGAGEGATARAVPPVRR